MCLNVHTIDKSSIANSVVIYINYDSKTHDWYRLWAYNLPVTVLKLKSESPFPTEFCQIASKAGMIGATSVSLARNPSLVKSFAISA